MKEFKPQTRVGQEVHKICINIRSEKDKDNFSSLYEDGCHIEKLKIVHQTDRKIALSNLWITTLDRLEVGSRKESHNTYLNDSSVCIRINDTIFANGVFGTIYTTGKTKPAINKLVKKMQSEVDSKYGFLCNMDIEIIVDRFIYGQN